MQQQRQNNAPKYTRELDKKNYIDESNLQQKKRKKAATNQNEDRVRVQVKRTLFLLLLLAIFIHF